MHFEIGERVTYLPTGETVKVIKTDYQYGKVEIEFNNGLMDVVELHKIEKFEVQIKKTRTDRHKDVLDEIHETFKVKNADYGNSFGEQFTEYGLISAVIRIEDKVRRLKQLLKQDAQVKDESIRDTIMDMSNYGIMTVMELDNKN